mgnify:CR=1 FL=1
MNIGIHASKNNNTLSNSINMYIKMGLISVQYFTHGPRGYNSINMDYSSIKRLKINKYVHSSYISSMCNTKTKIRNHIIDQFVSSNNTGSKGVVLHMPKKINKEIADSVLEIYNTLNEKKISNQLIILEMTAVKPDKTKSYESPDKINNLILELKSRGLTHKSVGICIDTAHIYAGKAKIRTYKDSMLYLKSLDYPEWICLIHLNGNEYDSKIRAGDKHALPLDSKDKIWNNISYKRSGCRGFVEWAVSRNIDIILEIKSHHTNKNVLDFIKKTKI